MKQLIECFEGLLDPDFDLTDDIFSIDMLCKRVQNDLYIKPSGTALKQLPKLINYMTIPASSKLTDNIYSWMKSCPVAKAMCDWICSKPKEWAENYQDGEFYVAFCNQCLTDAGVKKKWRVQVTDWRLRGNKIIGRKITVLMLMGSQWVELVRVAIEF